MHATNEREYSSIHIMYINISNNAFSKILLLWAWPPAPDCTNKNWQSEIFIWFFFSLRSLFRHRIFLIFIFVAWFTWLFFLSFFRTVQTLNYRVHVMVRFDAEFEEIILSFLESFLISTQSSIYMFFSWFGQLFRFFFLHFFIFYDRISLAITKHERKRRILAVQNDKYSKTGRKPGIQFNFVLYFCKRFFFACGTVCLGWKQIILKGTIREEKSRAALFSSRMKYERCKNGFRYCNYWRTNKGNWLFWTKHKW